VSGDEGRRTAWLRIPVKGWVAMAVVVGPLMLFGPGMVRGRVLFWGTPVLQFVPWRQFALSTLLQGHIPLWNPLVGLGAPLLANYQSALLYPPNWLQGAVGVAWGQALLVLLHLVWAGAGMVYLCRRLGLSWLAGTVSAVAFSLSGYLVARSGFLSINAAVAWLPWIIAAVDRLVGAESAEARSAPDVWAMPAVAGIYACQWLAGHAQVAWYTLLLSLLWAAWKGSKVLDRRGWVRVGERLGLALVLGFCLAAPQILPTIEFMAHSQRATAVARDLAMTYSFWPWRLSGLLAPGLFGSPVSGDFWGYGNFWEDAIYIGVAPTCLAFAAAWRGIRGKGIMPSLVRWLLGVSLVSLLIALGKNTPVFPFLYDHVPTFSLFQAPTRWTLWLVFALSLLAAIGVDDWGVAQGRGLYWLRLGTAGAVAVGLGAGVAAFTLQGLHMSFVRATALSGLWLAATGVLALTLRKSPGQLWKAALVGVVVADLTFAGLGLNPFGPPDLYAPPSALSLRLPAGTRLYMAKDVEYRFKYETAFRFDTFSPPLDFGEVRDAGLPNSPLTAGLPSANNFDPILPARYGAWMATLADMSPQQQSIWLDAMDVGLAAQQSDPQGIPTYVPRTPMGRAWFVKGAQGASSPTEALQLVVDPAFDPKNSAIIEGDIGPSVESTSAAGSASVTHASNPNALEVLTSSDTGGWVVVSAMSYPGWEAQVDGRPVDLYPADYIFSAVKVPAGAHLILLRYRSLAFMIGLALALVGACGLVVGVWYARRRV
jgi:hypothetical protein